jgi:hypothetical protein
LLTSVSGLAEGPALVPLFWLPLVATVAVCLMAGKAETCRRALKLTGASLLLAGTLVHILRNHDTLTQANLLPVSAGAILVAAAIAASAWKPRQARRDPQQASSPLPP